MSTDPKPKLREEVERYSQLAEVEEHKARAILTQMDLTLRKGQGKERWISLAINLIAGILLFLLGMVASLPLANWWRGPRAQTPASTQSAPALRTAS